jgi:branched-chain amino acid transport system substrate-binding protein
MNAFHYFQVNVVNAFFRTTPIVGVATSFLLVVFSITLPTHLSAQQAGKKKQKTVQSSVKSSSKGYVKPPESAILIDNTTSLPIKIGINIVDSDPLDLPQLYAAQLAVSEINAAGGITNRKLQLVVATSPNRSYDQVYSSLKKLIDGGITCILMPDGSELTLKAANFTVIKDVLLIATSSTSPEISALKDNDLVWRTALSDIFQGLVIAELLDSLKYKRTGVIFVNNSYGNGLFNSFREAYTKRGGTVTSVVSYPYTQNYRNMDFLTYLDTLYAAKPEAVYIISDIEDGIKITMQSQIYNFFSKAYKPMLVGCDANYSNDFLFAVNPSIIEGMMGLSYVRPMNSANHQRFITRYKQYLQEIRDSSAYASNILDGMVDSTTIDTYASTSYDAVYVLAYAIARANGSAISEDIAKNMRFVANAAPQAVLINTNEFTKGLDLIKKGKRINYNGVSGPIEFDDKGDVTGGSYTVWRVNKGRYTVTRVVSFP